MHLAQRDLKRYEIRILQYETYSPVCGIIYAKFSTGLSQYIELYLINTRQVTAVRLSTFVHRDQARRQEFAGVKHSGILGNFVVVHRS